MSAHEPSQFNSVEWKVHKFYESCMALSFVESDQDKPLLKVINKLGGWEVLRSFNIYAFDAHRVLKRLHAEYFVHAFFRVYVESDSYSGNKNIIYIMPDGLGMPHRYIFGSFLRFLIEGKIRCNSYKAKNSLLLSESFFEELLSILFVKCRNFQKRKRFFPEKYATQTCKFNFLQSRCLLHISYISFVTCSYVNLKK